MACNACGETQPAQLSEAGGQQTVWVHRIMLPVTSMLRVRLESIITCHHEPISMTNIWIINYTINRLSQKYTLISLSPGH
jgi:hypothetical protein